MKQLLVTTYPFSEDNNLFIKLLLRKNIHVVKNPYKRKIKEKELLRLIRNIDYIIAGTENYSEKIIGNANKLKLISRVGVGLDGINFKTLKSRNIKVCYTPDAVTPAVVDFTIGAMISSARKMFEANEQLKKGIWSRKYGKRLESCKIGIIGVGRIGSGVTLKLKKLGVKNIFINDIENKDAFLIKNKINFKSKDYIYRNSDIISIHTPLTSKTKNLINLKNLNKMKKDAILINSARGGIVNEEDLYKYMSKNQLFSAFIDVFENEPYQGKLTKLRNCILTSHMGSMSFDCRNKMENEAVENVLKFLDKKYLKNEVKLS